MQLSSLAAGPLLREAPALAAHARSAGEHHSRQTCKLKLRSTTPLTLNPNIGSASPLISSRLADGTMHGLGPSHRSNIGKVLIIFPNGPYIRVGSLSICFFTVLAVVIMYAEGH